jgi:hypothetical protein
MMRTRNQISIIGAQIFALGVSCGCAFQHPAPPELAADSRAQRVNEPSVQSPIELGDQLFVPGSVRLESMSPSTIDPKLIPIPAGKHMRVEVFAEGKNRQIRGHPPGGLGDRQLSQLRAEVIRSYLLAKGFVVTEAVGRGYDIVEGRQPDRRVVVYLVE